MSVITPIPALEDNYIWLINIGQQAVCIDPSDASPVLDYLQQHQLILSQIWITHAHHDHIGGIKRLLQQFPQCQVYGNADIVLANMRAEEGVTIQFVNHQAQVWLTSGHTQYHLSYLWRDDVGLHVFCGDTLFSAGCGRVFTGTIEQLFASFCRYNTLPAETLLYPAHEYTWSNLQFAHYIEPNNIDVSKALNAGVSVPSLPVSLAHERKINPFLRVHQPSVKNRVSDLVGRHLMSDMDVFSALRKLKNQFKS